MLKQRMGSWMAAIGLIATGVTMTSVAMAEDWPVGINCEIYDSDSGIKSELAKTAYGPWVIAERPLVKDGQPYSLRVEGSNKHAWGVIYLKNLNDGRYGIQYGPVGTHEKFRLNFDGWSIGCAQWPYIAG
jgi:hypothetical protein